MHSSAGLEDITRFGLVGCGRIAATHLQALSHLSGCQLLAVADERFAVAERVAKEYGCRPYPGHRELIREEDVDAVIICSPPNTHSEIAGAFLDMGVHVLCEKPLAISVAEAAQLVEMARTRDRVLMMASKFRYVDEVIKARDILRSGILGEIMLFENTFCSKVDMKDRWNSNPAVSGGGVMIDNGSHSVDIARYLLGPIRQIQAEEGKRAQGLQVEDTMRVYFRTSSDVLGSIDLSWSIHKDRESYIDLFGTEGVLSVGWKFAKYRQSETMEWVKFGNGYDKSTAFRNQLRNFVDSIRGTDTPLISPEDALASVCVIEKAYESVGMDKWLDVDSARPHQQKARV